MWYYTYTLQSHSDSKRFFEITDETNKELSEEIEIIKELLLKEDYYEITTYCIEKQNEALWKIVLSYGPNVDFPGIDRERIINQIEKILPNLQDVEGIAKTFKGYIAQNDLGMLKTFIKLIRYLFIR